MITPLVGILRHGASDAVRATAADRLAGLVALHHVRNQEAATAAGAVQGLGALVEKSARSATRTAAAACLAALVRDHPPSTEAAREGGMIESVAVALRNSRHDDETEAALEAAVWLARSHRASQVRASTHRGTQPHPTPHRTTPPPTPSQTAFVKAGLLETLEAGLVTNPAHCQSAAWLVATLVERNARNQTAAGRGELVPQLVGVLASASAPARTLQLVLKALSEIVKGDHANSTAAVECGAVSALRVLLGKRRRKRQHAPSRLQVAAKELLLELDVDVEYEAQLGANRTRHITAVLLVLVAMACATLDPDWWRWGYKTLRSATDRSRETWGGKVI